MKCAECGRPIQHAFYLDGKAYGYECYKKQLAIKFKQWENERNLEYSIECFSAMEVFKNKRNGSFHDSVCDQWNACKKLTAKQLKCIESGFTSDENIAFWCIQFNFTNDEGTKRSVAHWIETEILEKNLAEKYMNNDSVNDALLYVYRDGFHYFTDELFEGVFIGKNASLNEHLEYEDYEVIKVVESEDKQ